MAQIPQVPLTSIAERIRLHDAGREPERLAMKYKKMKESPFVFLRGACHLFYDALPELSGLNQAPLAWCCGDVHFENFGSYKGENRLVYFDINDFDEGALAPCTWDIVRLLTSIRCGADTLNTTVSETQTVSHDCLLAYREALRRGKSLWVERETATGLVGDLFADLREHSRREFLDRRTTGKSGFRQLKLDGIKALPADSGQQRKVMDFMAHFAADQPNPAFFKVLDVGRRIAGTGSLGVGRYVILIEGKGSPDGNYLLDLKEALPSSLIPSLIRRGIQQPPWADEAQRIVTIQKRLQVVDHAFLSPVNLAGVPCILKDLQPSEDRVTIGEWGRKLDRLRDVVGTLGRILAWDQLRAAGRGGAAGAEELMDFAQGEHWMPDILEAADTLSKETRRQWQEFCGAKL